MIINNLSKIMGEKRLKISDVINGTGLVRNTVADLYHGRTKRVDLETLDKLCTFLDCTPGDIFGYKENQDPKEEA